jgi:hypothetical protein
MYKIYKNEYINTNQITRIWLGSRRESGMLGDYSGSYDRTYYSVNVELSSGKVYTTEFQSLEEATEGLHYVVGRME